MYQLELVFQLLVRLQFMYFQYNVYTVKNDLLKIRKKLLTPTSAKMLLSQDVFLLRE